MTLTITVRLPPPARTRGARDLLRALLPLVEPTALLLAEAAGVGLPGRIACATALRAARQALGHEPRRPGRGQPTAAPACCQPLPLPA